jgi:hypothetical protein
MMQDVGAYEATLFVWFGIETNCDTVWIHGIVVVVAPFSLMYCQHCNDINRVQGGTGSQNDSRTRSQLHLR